MGTPHIAHAVMSMFELRAHQSAQLDRKRMELAARNISIHVRTDNFGKREYYTITAEDLARPHAALARKLRIGPDAISKKWASASGGEPWPTLCGVRNHTSRRRKRPTVVSVASENERQQDSVCI